MFILLPQDLPPAPLRPGVQAHVGGLCPSLQPGLSHLPLALCDPASLTFLQASQCALVRPALGFHVLLLSAWSTLPPHLLSDLPPNLSSNSPVSGIG